MTFAVRTSWPDVLSPCICKAPGTLYTCHSALLTSSYVSSEAASKLTSGMRTQLRQRYQYWAGLRRYSINACNFFGALQCFLEAQ